MLRHGHKGKKTWFCNVLFGQILSKAFICFLRPHFFWFLVDTFVVRDDRWFQKAIFLWLSADTSSNPFLPFSLAEENIFCQDSFHVFWRRRDPSLSFMGPYSMVSSNLVHPGRSSSALRGNTHHYLFEQVTRNFDEMCQIWLYFWNLHELLAPIGGASYGVRYFFRLGLTSILGRPYQWAPEH